MKLNLEKKKSVSDRILGIIGTKTESKTTGKEPEKMKLNLKKIESKPEPEKLNLSKTKSIMKRESEITIEKLDRVEKLYNKVFDLDSSFNDFLKNQNESISVINSFNSKLDNLEILILNGIKNQKSILDGINSFHAILMNQKTTGKEPEPKQEPEKTILRKGTKTESEPEKIETDSILTIESIYDIFQGFFSGSFYGSKESTVENLQVFQALMESIEIESVEKLKESIKLFNSRLYKENQKYLVARKSTKKFIDSLLKTIELLEPEKTITTGKEPEPVKNLEYFSSLFQTDSDTIRDLLNELKEYGSIDSDSIESVSNYLQALKPDTTDHMIGSFIKFAQVWIEMV